MNEETEQREPENNKRIAGLTAGLEDRCNVLDCPEHWRCLDIDKPQRCALWRMTEREKQKRKERYARYKARQQQKAAEKPRQQQKTAEKPETEKRFEEYVNKTKSHGGRIPLRVRHVESGVIYESVSAASRATGKSKTAILNQARKGLGAFEYVNVNGERIERDENNALCNFRRKVRNIETGEIYESVKEAAELNNMKRNAMAYQLRKSKNPRFEYVDE